MMTQQIHKSKPVAIVRGVGDVGSAIAWKLFKVGFLVICHENRQPRTIRRKMAFCDALWNGDCVLAGLKAVRVDRLEHLLPFILRRNEVAVYSGPFEALVETIQPALIVDGRIQKFSKVETLQGLAPLTIAVGPSFIAGEHVDYVIESCWGDDLGCVLSEGSAAAPVPVPPRLNGIGWERFVFCEGPGRFESHRQIGEHVSRGEIIGRINGRGIPAPIAGYLRGLLTPGLSVIKGEKICEIDPRGDRAHFEGLAERPRGIAEGVLKAISEYVSQSNTAGSLKTNINQEGLAFLLS